MKSTLCKRCPGVSARHASPRCQRSRVENQWLPVVVAIIERESNTGLDSGGSAATPAKSLRDDDSCQI